MTTMVELRKMAREEALEAVVEADSDADRWDLAHEVADGLVPEMTTELLEVAMSELGLMFEEPDLEAKSPYEMLQYVIFEDLEAIAAEEIESYQREHEDDEAEELTAAEVADFNKEERR